MLRESKTICFVVFSALVFFCSSVFAVERSPKESVEELLRTIQKIQTKEKLTSEQERANRSRSEKALKYLNITEISQKALGKYWSKITENEQQKFSNMLGELFIYVAFPGSGEFFADLDWVFSESEVNKNEAVVPIKLTHKDEGEIEIDFFLKLNPGGWKIVDVYLDGVSMRNNLRAKFYKIISKKNFDELVARMMKKLEESKAWTEGVKR